MRLLFQSHSIWLAKNEVRVDFMSMSVVVICLQSKTQTKKKKEKKSHQRNEKRNTFFVIHEIKKFVKNSFFSFV